MYKIAVIGDYDSIYGFAALGLATFPAGDAESGTTLLRRLAQGDYGIIYVTEALAAMIKDEIDRYDEQIRPAIIRIPGVSGNTGEGIAQVKSFVERAVGSDIIFNEGN